MEHVWSGLRDRCQSLSAVVAAAAAGTAASRTWSAVPGAAAAGAPDMELLFIQRVEQHRRACRGSRVRNRVAFGGGNRAMCMTVN